MKHCLDMLGRLILLGTGGVVIAFGWVIGEIPGNFILSVIWMAFGAKAIWDAVRP